MNNKIISTVTGVFGVLLWFTPFVYVEFMGVHGHQAGHHIGGIAYLLLVSLMAYVVLSWLELHTPRIIAALLATTIGLLFSLQAGSNIAWGLIGVVILSITEAALAVWEIKFQKSSKT